MSKEGQWFLYVVKCSDGTLYCGITVDIDRRIRAHNGVISGGAKYTRSRRPVALVFLKKIGSRSDATKEELNFKRLTRAKKLELIKMSMRL